MMIFQPDSTLTLAFANLKLVFPYTAIYMQEFRLEQD